MDSLVLESVDVGVNTETVNVDKLEDVLKVDKNGFIQPKTGEILVEMSVSHDVSSWDDVMLIIQDKMGLISIGRPWIANSGRLYKTIGFRTREENYEKWRLGTYNWQDSGIRKVSSSKLYR